MRITCDGELRRQKWSSSHEHDREHHQNHNSRCDVISTASNSQEDWVSRFGDTEERSGQYNRDGGFNRASFDKKENTDLNIITNHEPPVILRFGALQKKCFWYFRTDCTSQLLVVTKQIISLFQDLDCVLQPQFWSLFLTFLLTSALKILYFQRNGISVYSPSLHQLRWLHLSSCVVLCLTTSSCPVNLLS